MLESPPAAEGSGWLVQEIPPSSVTSMKPEEEDPSGMIEPPAMKHLVGD
jgi:hypothetical protein